MATYYSVSPPPCTNLYEKDEHVSRLCTYLELCTDKANWNWNSGLGWCGWTNLEPFEFTWTHLDSIELCYVNRFENNWIHTHSVCFPISDVNLPSIGLCILAHGIANCACKRSVRHHLVEDPFHSLASEHLVDIHASAMACQPIWGSNYRCWKSVLVRGFEGA